MNFISYKKSPKHFYVDLIELFMTAPTPPVKEIINGKPVFYTIKKAERVRIELYSELSKGAIGFAKDYIKFFKNLNIYFSCEMLIDWMKTFITTPSELDKTMFFNVEYSPDIQHRKYLKLFNKWYN